MNLKYWLYLALVMMLAASVTMVGCGGDGDDDDSAVGDDDDTTGDDDDTSGDDDDSTGDDDDSATGDDDDSATGDDDDSAAAGDDDDSAAAGPSCAEYCALRAANCSETAASCEVACGLAVSNGMPLGTAGDAGGNSLACRIYHSDVAGSTGDASHCGHGNLFGGTSADGFPCVGNIAEAYCALMMANCAGEYADSAACMTAAAGLADTGNLGDTSGDTIQCRIYHAEVAASDSATHCPHAMGAAPCQ